MEEEIYVESFEVVCGCGRTMCPVWDNPMPSYKCGCGAKLRKVYPPISKVRLEPGYCQMWIEKARCGKPVIPSGMREYASGGKLCKDCAKTLLDEAIDHPATRKYLVENLGRREIAIARQYIAMQEFHERLKAEDERKKASQTEAVHVVYYVRLGENHIKIGTTGRLEERMLELRVANRSNLLAAEPGSYDVEKQRHRKFGLLKYDRRREDFEESPRLLGHILKVRDQWGDPWDLPARLVAGQVDGELESA